MKTPAFTLCLRNRYAGPVLTIAVIAAFCPAAGFASLTATGDIYYTLQAPGAGYINALSAGTTHVSLTPVLGANGMVVKGGAVDGSNQTCQACFFTSNTSGFAYVDANYGILRSSVESSSDALPLVQAQGNGVIVGGDNPFHPSSYVKTTASYTDSLKVYDPNLPLGAPVTFKISETENELISDYCSPDDASYCDGNPTGAAFSLEAITSVGQYIIFGDEYVYRTYAFAQAHNGETITLTGTLDLTTGSRAGFDATGLFGTASQDHFVDATHTFINNVDPVTAGLQIDSLSGRDYATGAPITQTATPEPSTWGLGGACLLILFGSRRRLLVSGSPRQTAGSRNGGTQK